MTATANITLQTDAFHRITSRTFPARKKALVIETRPCLAMLLEQMCARHGMDTEILRNGADALVRLKDGAADFDLVCSDVELPGASGWTLLEWVRTRQPGVPFLLISGSRDEDFSREANRRGAVPAFRKPFDLAEVQQILAGVFLYL